MSAPFPEPVLVLRNSRRNVSPTFTPAGRRLQAYGTSRCGGGAGMESALQVVAWTTFEGSLSPPALTERTRYQYVVAAVRLVSAYVVAAGVPIAVHGPASPALRSTR